MTHEYDVTVFYVWANGEAMADVAIAMQRIMIDTAKLGGRRKITHIPAGPNATMVILETWVPRA